TQSVDFATQDGTAKAGVNYLPVSGTLTFFPGERKKFFYIQIVNDTVPDGAPTFQVVLSNPTGGALLDDAGGRADVAITHPDYPGNFFVHGGAAETVGSAVITVQRGGGDTGLVTVDYATSDGTARAGTDYTAASGTLTFNPGEDIKTFQVPVFP